MDKESGTTVGKLLEKYRQEIWRCHLGVVIVHRKKQNGWGLGRKKLANWPRSQHYPVAEREQYMLML